MTLIIVLASLMAVLVWVAVTPVRLVVHTAIYEYKLQWGWLFNARIIPLADDLKIRLAFPFFHKDFYPLHPSKAGKKPQKAEKKDKKKKKRGRFPFRLIRRILQTFKVREFSLNMDTDNYITNAYLYPAFYFLDLKKGKWRINYDGQFELNLDIENRPLWIIVALIRHYAKVR